MKDNVKITGRQATNWKKRFVKDTSDNGLLSKIYKEHLTFNNKKTNHTIKKWTQELNKHPTKKDIRMGNKHMKNAPNCLSSGKCKLK